MAIGYLVSSYPAVSHTFVRREVTELRRRGAEIHTFSVRRPRAADLVGAADREELARTWHILPVRAAELLRAHLRMLAARPAAYASTLVRALRHRTPGLRALRYALFYFAEAVRLADELERRGVSHLHSHFSNSGATVGLLAAALLGIDWSLTLHGSADLDGATRPLLGQKIEAARFVACASQYLRSQAWRAVSPDCWERIFVSRCGIDLGDFRPPAQGARGPAGGPLRILCVGRLAPEKGHRGLLEALAQLLAGGVDARLCILGEGPERAALEARCGELSLGERVSLPGSTDEAGVVRALHAADVFALSSLMEGLPVVLMEAMACGVPVVAPRLCGIPELVEDGRSGLLYTPGAWDELAAALRRLAGSPELQQALALAGRSRVEADHAIARAVLPLWERLRHAA
jgi:glycosyltransferase involved in cell wall biosynthesis